MLFDPAVVEAVGTSVPTWLAALMVVLSYLGSVYLIAPAVIAAYWSRRDLVAPWLGAVIGCYGLMSITKNVHDAARPTVEPPVGAEPFPEWFLPGYEHAVFIDTASFPSGHALVATVVAGLFVVDLRVSSFPRRALAGAIFVGWVGFTRLGLGVHYPGDVLGGIGYGLAFLGVYYAVRRGMVRRELCDETAASFALAAVAGAAAIGVSGSRNAHIVFGGAMGGLLAWYYVPRVTSDLADSSWRALLAVASVLVIVGTWFVTHLEIGTAAFIVGWSGLFLAAIVFLPWIVRMRSIRSSVVGWSVSG